MDFLLTSFCRGRVSQWSTPAGPLCGARYHEIKRPHFPLAKSGRVLCFLALSVMQKTKKSVAKRFKLSATGKLIRRTPGFRHLLAAKSTKSKRRASRDKLVAEGHAKPLKRCLPFGL